MKKGMKVSTRQGYGKIIETFETGILEAVVLVRIDNISRLSDPARQLHEAQGGLYFHKNEILSICK